MDLLNSLQSYTDFGLLAVRIAVASIFFVHGKSKWPMWTSKPPKETPAQMQNLLKFTSILETVGSILVLIGFYTQIGALLLVIVMLGALYFKLFKWKVSFTGNNGWELDLILLAALLVLLTTGPGSILILQ